MESRFLSIWEHEERMARAGVEGGLLSTVPAPEILDSARTYNVFFIGMTEP